MDMKIVKTTLALMAWSVVTASAAYADHEVIVVPERTTTDTQIRYRGPYITPYVSVGIGAGGDVIGQFTDGYGEVERVRSGGGLLLEGGLLMAVDPYTNLRLTGGYEVDSASRFNGQSTFDRIRFDLMMLRKFGSTDLGVGLTAHTDVGYRCDINTICSGDVEFDPAIGYTVEYALTTAGMNFHGSRDRRYNPLRDARIGLRFTDIEYRPRLTPVEDIDNSLVDGKALSAFVGFAW